jgi:perosamine synthetase
MQVNAAQFPEKPVLLGGAPPADVAPFPRDRVQISDAGIEAATAVLRSGKWSMFTSEEVALFESEFADFVGAEHAVMVNSCTSALFASLIAAGIRAGDRVAVPAYTYVGSAMPILALGAIPVPIDIDPENQSMLPADLAAMFGRYAIRAVIHVHLFGQSVYVDEIAALCRRNGAAYIADCAQFLGNRPVTAVLAQQGAVCFSFGDSKLLRIGEGGAIATNFKELAEKLRRVRHEGEQWTRLDASRLAALRPVPRDVMSGLASVQHGLNFRPLAVAAAIGRVMLRELPARLDVIHANAAVLNDMLAGQDGLLPPTSTGRTWWTYPVRVNDHLLPRDIWLAALLAEGIPAGVHFPLLIPEHPVVRASLDSPQAHYPGAARFAETHFVLPIYPGMDGTHLRQIGAACDRIGSHAQTLMNEESHLRARELLNSRAVEELCSGLFLFLSPAKQ